MKFKRECRPPMTKKQLTVVLLSQVPPCIMGVVIISRGGRLQLICGGLIILVCLVSMAILGLRFLRAQQTG